jgi:hypothetical protein
VRAHEERVAITRKGLSIMPANAEHWPRRERSAPNRPRGKSQAA